MATPPLKVTMLGGHGSGKTTFLAALWSSVKSAADTAPARLRGHLPPNTAYLDEAEHALMGGENVPRTKRDTGERVLLELSIDGSPLDVRHLDVAGETFEALLEHRTAPTKLLAELASSDSLMLFINPEQVRSPYLISQALRLTAAAGHDLHAHDEDAENAADLASDDPDPQEVWKAAPSAVHLVDLLQIVLSNSDAILKPQLAVVVSAWDTICDSKWGQGEAPYEWICRVLPLLHQYLENNGDLFNWRAFGVSAQGCDFADQGAVDELVTLPCAERTVVVSDGAWTRDIAEPLRWLARLQT